MIVYEEFYIDDIFIGQVQQGYIELSSEYVPGSVLFYLNGQLQNKKKSEGDSTGIYREDTITPSNKVYFEDPYQFKIGDWFFFSYVPIGYTVPTVPGGRVWGDLHILLSEALADKVSSPNDDGLRWSFGIRQAGLLNAYNQIIFNALPVDKSIILEQCEIFTVYNREALSNLSFDGNYQLIYASCEYNRKKIDLKIKYKPPTDFDYFQDFLPSVYFYKSGDRFYVSITPNFSVNNITLYFLRIDNFDVNYPIVGSFWSKFSAQIISTAMDFLTKLETQTL